MKKNNFLPEAAKHAAFGAAIIVFAASSFILTSCKKDSSSAAAPASTSASAVTRQRSASFGQTALSSTGTNNGFYWQCYYTTGSASLTNGSAGNFSVTYSGVGDVVAGKGYNPGSAQTIGYNVGALSGSYNFVGVYGWTTSPLIEYYVCELGSVVAGTQVNTVSSDGHTYTFYKHQQVSQPSIQGTATFWQYLDNWGGSSTGANHSINMANHVNNWQSNGGQGFGSYNYQILALEAYSGKSGYINATVW
ncbi:endo-1,4-beta-xylanase [Mucilaginibacter mallensis]|uniref:endo-1,4-beta-xylanase n=1 Tax=Mucilaginibacter mallensis TaxID=652787 RepID=A0A1H1T2K5_MUCMA|nr:glycoside hydrolase family 11 protein [Mucilaginibacter mallensis]SDS54460.1 endo-1,4-beta-xylanase [Mucilaginibacter mallensis]